DHRGIRQPDLPEPRLCAQPHRAGTAPARAALTGPMSDSLPPMTSHRPYLLRALYEWIADNGLTPHLLVDATRPGVQVRRGAVQDGRVVLNGGGRAVAGLGMDTERSRCGARFGGVSRAVRVPAGAVLAFYARETGRGMALPDDPVAEDGG